MATVNQVSKPPLMVPMLDSSGAPSKAWAIWFRDIFDRVASKTGNAIDDNLDSLESIAKQVVLNVAAIQLNADNIAINAANIADNTLSIIQNTLAISDNADDISDNAADILTNSIAIAY